MPEQAHDDIRRLLERVAQDAPTFAPAPARTVRRARRRAGSTIALASLAVIAVVIVGLRTLPGTREDGIADPDPSVVSPTVVSSEPSRGLYAVDIETGERALLAEPPEGVVGVFISMQADRVAYLADVDGSSQVFVMNADGSDRIQLTDGQVGRWAPVWSPDGSQIAYVGWAPDSGYEIYIIDVESRVSRQLTTERRDVTQSPAWALDGGSLFFQTSRPADGGSSPTQIVRKVAVATGESITIVDDAGQPDPSPDGTRIAFATWSRYRVTVANSDGSARRIIPTPDGAAYAKWSPDGERLAFVLGFLYDPGQWRVGTIIVRDIATGETAFSVPGFLVDWIDDRTILVFVG